MADAGPAAVQTFDADVSYGRIRAVQGASLEVRPGAVTALVGANGAGKSSLLKAIAGVVSVDGGRVEAGGRDITAMPAHVRVRELGLVLVPEGRGVFGGMTVAENLALGTRIGSLRGAENGGAAGDQREVLDIFPALKPRLELQARYLSGGEQQMLSLARALLMRPEVLLVDEPSLGLAPLVVKDIFTTLRGVLESRGVTVLLVEQDTELAMSIASWAYVIERGVISAAGSPDELISSGQLQDAYLGAKR